MLIIELKENESIDKALRRYKRKFKETRLMEEMRERREFTKPSIKRRKEVIKARFKQSLADGRE